MSGIAKLVTPGGGGVSLTPGGSIAADITLNLPTTADTLVGRATTDTLSNKTGLSATATAANNLRGTVTFSAATTKAVMFGVAEPDASYFIALSGNATGYCWVTSKATTGFTINCSVSNSNAVDWLLIR